MKRLVKRLCRNVEELVIIMFFLLIVFMAISSAYGQDLDLEACPVYESDMVAEKDFQFLLEPQCSSPFNMRMGFATLNWKIVTRVGKNLVAVQTTTGRIGIFEADDNGQICIIAGHGQQGSK